MDHLVIEYRLAYPFRFLALTITALITISSCSSDWREPPDITQEEFTAEHEDWRSDREQALVTPPSGPVLWSGLFDLPQGESLEGRN